MQTSNRTAWNAVSGENVRVLLSSSSAETRGGLVGRPIGLEGCRVLCRRGETKKGSWSPSLIQNTAGLQYNSTGILRLQLNESKYFRNFGQKFNTSHRCVVLCSCSAVRVSLKWMVFTVVNPPPERQIFDFSAALKVKVRHPFTTLFAANAVSMKCR